MIIVIEQYPTGDTDQEKTRALSNILMAHGEGKHVTWMPSKTIEKIIDAGIITGYNLQILYELKESARLTKTLTSHFEFYAEVDFENQESLGFSNNKLHLSYLHFTDSAFVQPNMFIAEHYYDIDFYKLGAQVYLRKENLLSAYSLKFRPVNGGGNSILGTFERHLNEHEKIICILDSDKNHPNAPYKLTAAQFNHHIKGWGEHYWLHVLESTEAENLVPRKVAIEILNKIENYDLDKFMNISPEVRKFIDHKKGMTLAEARELDLLYNSDYWSTHLDPHYHDEGDICQQMGPNFLKNCIDYMQKLTVHKLTEMFEARDADLLTLSKMVASWGVCPKRSIR